MKCYGQLVYESGSYATPFPDDYTMWPSIKAATNALKSCWGDMDVDPSSVDQGVTLLLWLGEPDPEAPFPCDMANFYPDHVYTLGINGGAKRIE